MSVWNGVWVVVSIGCLAIGDATNGGVNFTLGYLRIEICSPRRNPALRMAFVFVIDSERACHDRAQ